MSSDESDDEPLAALAAAKKTNPEQFENITSRDEPVKKKKKILTPKKLTAMTIKINRALKAVSLPPAVERPMDVWLYLKDLNPTGPYSCLLCSEWFINRSKMIVHYILNHKKDFCGICRYFVPDREAWQVHLKFHTPWPCSQCTKNFDTEADLRQHFSSQHGLVHCRMCHFRVSDNDQYDTHLLKKHTVSNVQHKDEDTLWEFEYEGSNKFTCILCSKENIMSSTFFNHYMGYHHFTLKCLSSIISGRDLPFLVGGADISASFIDGQLKEHTRLGYVDLEQKPIEQGHESDHSESAELLKVLIPEIKQEALSEPEDSKTEDDKADNKKKVVVRDENDIANVYKGDEDFDVTMTELIVLQKCYFDYVKNTLNSINSNSVPLVSDIDYESAKYEVVNMVCTLCNNNFDNVLSFSSHMSKMHLIKISAMFSCRVCAATFDSQPELETHIAGELGDFEDLWICQFCDKEFDNRVDTRRHLIEHLGAMEFDNCFSPHLGFKCKFCPTLFWNETDREMHQVRVHLDKYKDQFYKCEECSEVFSDKIWLIHHFIEKHNVDENKSSFFLKCCLCSVVMAEVDGMRSHFEKVHPEARKVFCSLDSCQYRPLSHRKSFKFHVRTLHDPAARAAPAPVACSVCGREFGSNRACGAHVAQVHGPGKFKCKLCREVMNTLDERKLHYLIRHPGRHPFECAECGKSFQYKSSLYMHKQEHSPNKQSYTCTYCSKVFVKRDSYREHLQIHEGPRHACSYCPMRFVQRSNMLRHERRHTGERPYACPQCPRTFSDKGACTSHVRTHSKERSYACIYCGQTFVQKSKLTYHIRKHTGENLETCTICSKLFTSACSLREHMKIHQAKNKESVQCPLCDKKYQDERYMLRHLRTSHTRSHFPCPLCPKTLTSAVGLRHHVVTHSGVNTFRCKCCPKTYAVKRSMVKHLRKRHSLKAPDVSVKDYFSRVDPRDCNLALSEEAMTQIFGPVKKTMNDILIGDFVTFTKKLNNLQSEDNDDDDGNDDGNDGNEGNDSDEGDGNDETAKVQAPEVVVKTEKPDLEPTDFVSVKIEPVDEDECH